MVAASLDVSSSRPAGNVKQCHCEPWYGLMFDVGVKCEADGATIVQHRAAQRRHC